MFNGCSNLTSIRLDNITTLADGYIFQNCNLTGVLNLPKLTSAGRSEFEGNILLEEINIGSDVPEQQKITQIGSASFQSCTSLRKVTGLSKLINLPGSLFSSCSSLEEVDVNPTGTISYSFMYCSSLTCINIANATSIDYRAFLNCSSLLDLNTSDPQLVDSSTPRINTLNTTSIGSSAFDGTLLTNVKLNLPNATSLSDSCFKNTQIIEVSIPSCTSIGNRVFSGCSALTTVKFGSDLTSIGTQAFYNCSNLTTVQVPTAKLSDYQAAFPDLASKMVAY